jgi:transcriptional regulator GlxA family with amidase domain
MTRRVGLLIFPDVQILDVAGPVAAFEIAGRHVAAAYTVEVLATRAGTVCSSSGIGITAEPFAPAERLDTLIVAGGDGTRSASKDQELLAAVREAAGYARRVASVCSGAFILAAAGLLDRRRATTHWSLSQDFNRRFPQVRLEPDLIYVKDGNFWTSAGITAGIDMSLAMIAEDLGDAVARHTAQQLVVYHRRPGGQSQFSALLELDRPDARFTCLIGWARERLSEPLGVERLAEQVSMSPRHFARAFAAETGVTPARAIERLRIESARARVEAGIEPIDRVASAVGFGDAERMRRAFIRVYGHPPQALRRAARSRG